MDATVQLIEDLTDVALGRKAEAPVITARIDRSEVLRHLGSAQENAGVDALPDPPGRSLASKRMILKGGRFVLTRQRAVNQALIGVIHGLLHEIDSLQASVEQERRRTAAATVAIDSKLVQAASVQHQRVDELRTLSDERHREHRSSLDEQERRLQSLVADLISAGTDEAGTVGIALNRSITAALSASQAHVLASQDLLTKRVDDLNAELLTERHRREVLERQLRGIRSEMTARLLAQQSLEEIDSSGAPPADSGLSELYERFEQFFRPTGVDLDNRFVDYVPDLEHLRDGTLRVIDIGTGRGDFLDVLRTAGIPAVGIDTNVDAVNAAHERGLDVELIDARTYLAGLDNESVGAVTAFHVVEHLDPADLLDLVDEIVRVLAPGGTVILETPNPTNLVVGAASFYHDPTHRRPLTPDYLSFVLRDRGLVDVQTRFLHPLPEYDLKIELADVPGQLGVQALLEDVRWALKGPQDFAVVGRGPGGS